jgi:hypothetical protein
MLILKPTNLPSKPTDDYEVFDEDRKVIGRIVWTHVASRATPWLWTLFRGHGPQSPADKGYAATREDAMAAFKAAWSPQNAVRLRVTRQPEISSDANILD